MFGLYFGFIKFKLRISPKIVLTLQCIFYCMAGKFLFYSIMSQEFFIGIITFLLQYFICALLLTFVKEDLTFCNLFNDLRTIDIGLKVNNVSYNLEIKLLLSIITCLLFRISVNLLNCMYSKFIKLYDWIMTCGSFFNHIFWLECGSHNFHIYVGYTLSIAGRN